MKNTFLTGLILALILVVTDFLDAFITHGNLDYKSLLVAVLIAGFGYLGKFLNGKENTSIAMIGSAILVIIPLLQEGHINWSMVAATFALKLLGLFSAKLAQPEPKK
jgi:hypothetical protein